MNPRANNNHHNNEDRRWARLREAMEKWGVLSVVLVGSWAFVWAFFARPAMLDREAANVERKEDRVNAKKLLDSMVTNSEGLLRVNEDLAKTAKQNADTNERLASTVDRMQLAAEKNDSAVIKGIENVSKVVESNAGVLESGQKSHALQVEQLGGITDLCTQSVGLMDDARQMMAPANADRKEMIGLLREVVDEAKRKREDRPNSPDGG
jgi:hypothetical protein